MSKALTKVRTNRTWSAGSSTQIDPDGTYSGNKPVMSRPKNRGNLKDLDDF
jgi:hypothetical protein